jgi:hypothetical protein
MGESLDRKEYKMSTQLDVQPGRRDTEPYASVLEELNSKMQGSAEATLAFAPPQTYGDLTVIPVARVRSRSGGGFGMGKPGGQEHVQEGVGIVGTLSVIPVGYIEVKEGRARFRPIIMPDMLVRMQVVGGGLALLTLAVVGRLFGRRPVGGRQRRRGPVFKVVASPGASIWVGRGRARRRQGLRPRRALHERRPRVPSTRRLSGRGRFSRVIGTVGPKTHAPA